MMGGRWLAHAGEQHFLINRMATATAAFPAPFNYMALIFSTPFIAIIFAPRPDRASPPGGAMIVAGALWLALCKGRKGLRGLRPGASVVK